MDAIRMIGIVKCFGPVRANDGIDFIVGAAGNPLPPG